MTARESYKVADALRSGNKSDVQAWVPDSALWVNRVTGESNATRVTAAGNVASSPVGVAMVPSAAKSLGWPGKTYTWTELAGAAMRDDRLRLGAADPVHSAAGLLALTQLGTAAATVKGGDTQAAAMAKTLSQRTSDSDSQVLATLPRDSSGTEQGNPQPQPGADPLRAVGVRVQLLGRRRRRTRPLLPQGRITAARLPLHPGRRVTAEHRYEPCRRFGS